MLIPVTHYSPFTAFIRPYNGPRCNFQNLSYDLTGWKLYRLLFRHKLLIFV